MQIIYEPHPVSAKRKAELRAQGYRIVDLQFAPDHADGAPGTPKAPKIEAMRKGDLIDLLATLGVDAPARATVAELREMAAKVAQA